ncbi:MAG TPA: hypothetical protein VNZ26_04555 [Vicinamibacterales bacterium]|jgi:hypothetical protein|nr:hypothetical protein [Vicinamibacterales bacterium]
MATRARLPIAVAFSMGLMLGAAATPGVQSIPGQPPTVRRAIRPGKAPNTGLPYSPGILVGKP